MNTMNTNDFTNMLQSMMTDGKMEVPMGGTTTVHVSPLLSHLLTILTSPLELNLLSNTNPQVNTHSLHQQAMQKARQGVDAFGKSMLDAPRLLQIAQQYVQNPNASLSQEESHKIQYVVLSEMLATLTYLQLEVQKAGESAPTNIPLTEQRLPITIAGEHVLYIHMLLFSMLYGVRSGHVNGMDANHIDTLIQELKQNGSVKTNNPVEMLVLYLLDITAQYTNNVGKKTIHADEWKNLITDNGTLNIHKLQEYLNNNT